MTEAAKPNLIHEALSKAPPAILMFWVVKICATTVGETGGDALSMSLKLGYLVATLIFLAFFGLIVGAFARLALPGRDPLSIPATILEVTRQPQSRVTVRECLNASRQALKDADAVNADDNVPAEVLKRVVPGLCRTAAVLGGHRDQRLLRADGNSLG